MDYEKLKREIFDDVWKELIVRLSEIQPIVMEDITKQIKMDYEKRIFEQSVEIAYLQERIKLLEENFCWAKHNFESDL